MIIRYPTALYASVLPAVDATGNVTFTISSDDPPRISNVPSPLQGSGTGQSLPARTIGTLERREALGDMVYVVASGASSGISNGKKAYEVGQLLDFDTEEELPQVNNKLVSNEIQLQQNTNVLDLAAAGFTEEEAKQLTDNAILMLNKSVSELNSINSVASSLKAQIQDNQRLLNELYKIKEASSVVLNDPAINKKLDDREKELQAQRNQLVNDLNNQSALAEAKYAEILRIKEVVR